MSQLGSVLVLLFSQWQAPKLPRRHPLSDEYQKERQEDYRQWKPGPKVAMEIGRLSERIQELNTAFSRGEIVLKALSVEWQGVGIQQHLTLCLALVAAPRNEVPAHVVVLVNNREIMKVFPNGGLPEDPLNSNYVYETEQGGEALCLLPHNVPLGGRRAIWSVRISVSYSIERRPHGSRIFSLSRQPNCAPRVYVDDIKKGGESVIQEDKLIERAQEGYQKPSACWLASAALCPRPTRGGGLVTGGLAKGLPRHRRLPR